MSGAINIRPVMPDEMGTVFKPGLPLTAEHLRREFRFVLATALSGTAVQTGGRFGILSCIGDQATPFCNVTDKRLLLLPFSFILENGFCGATEGILEIDKPRSPADIKLVLREITRPEVRDEEVCNRRRFSLGEAQTLKEDGETVLSSFVLYWDGSTLWPVVADFRATKEWREKATELAVAMRGLADAMRTSGGAEGQAAAVGIFALNGQTFPAWRPWWRDSVVEGVLLGTSLARWVRPAPELPELKVTEPWSDSPAETKKLIELLKTQLEAITASFKRPYDQPEVQFKGKRFRAVALSEVVSADMQKRKWEGQLELSLTGKTSWESVDLLAVLPKSAQSPEIDSASLKGPVSHKAWAEFPVTVWESTILNRGNTQPSRTVELSVAGLDQPDKVDVFLYLGAE